MGRNKSYYLSLGAPVLGLAALTAFPALASDGVREGLEICAGVIVPSLLPFFIVSSLMAAQGLPQVLAHAAERPMRILFGLPGASCAPLLLGLTGGYPAGAAALSELVRRGQLSRETGERLLPVCNNTGPAFLIGAAGSGVFGSVRCGLLLYAAHVCAALFLGRFLAGKTGSAEAPFSAAPAPEKGLAAALTEAVRGSVGAVLNVCGFVLFFSVLRSLLDGCGLLPELAGKLGFLTGLGPGFCRALLTGLLELGGGIAAMSGLPLTPASLALAAFLIGFGSLSVHGQTVAVTADARMRCTRHFGGKLLHGVLSAFLVYLLSPIVL